MRDRMSRKCRDLVIRVDDFALAALQEAVAQELVAVERGGVHQVAGVQQAGAMIDRSLGSFSAMEAQPAAARHAISGKAVDFRDMVDLACIGKHAVYGGDVAALSRRRRLMPM